MTHWLVANPKAGSGERGREFWRDALASAGITDPECCDFGDDDWADRVKAGDVVMVAGGDGSVNRGAQLCVKKEATPENL